MPGREGRRLQSRAPARLFIKSYGCQMNVYDAERMADLLAPLGYGCPRRPTRPTS